MRKQRPKKRYIIETDKGKRTVYGLYEAKQEIALYIFNNPSGFAYIANKYIVA
jgi:hypothetical protein